MKKIKIVIALIFLLSILLAIIFSYINEQRSVSNNFLNVINQQKAFTQEIAKNIFYMYKNQNASDKQLDDSIKKFLSNMQNRDKNLKYIDSKEIREHSKEIAVLWNKFYLEVQNFRDLNKVTVAYSNLILEELVNKIYNLNLDLVVEFNTMIDIYHKELENNISTYRNIEYILFLVLVICLIYLVSQVKDLIKFFQKFTSASKRVISNASVIGIKKIEETKTVEDVASATYAFNTLVEKIDTSILNATNSIENTYANLHTLENDIENFIELISEMHDGEEIDKELTKKEDILIESLEELNVSAENLKNLKRDFLEFANQKRD
ncbi:cell wall metabolism sensor histidine kinase WalK [Sulfurimonas lithotrophica]|uniref:Cell wall metabolism sensor histidine kinase WalK n=1 Tax=Sulfurimonas lithotrophica TaxID=2590022 RepID=A0A5P8NZF9_9BACT|nr:hypothetical protein [Sulfurimonas lithotrophica]QFR48727.1 cell wall metabolism sensor histidine kinase WalK [Sulfurimonas lithotrophica]